jgi:hypothetical protein
MSDRPSVKATAADARAAPVTGTIADLLARLRPPPSPSKPERTQTNAR